MIDHSDCDHPSTSSARAKCRRARADGREFQEGGQTQEAGPRTPTAPTQRERNRGTTPRDKDKQCDVCGVERILYRGTDPLSGVMLTVGDRCLYYIQRSKDLQVLP